MAYAVIAQGDGLGTDAVTLNTIGANLIVIFKSADDTAAPTDGQSNTWTGLTARDFISGKARLWYCFAPTTHAAHTFTAGDAYDAICVLALSGAVMSPADQDNGSNGDGSNHTSRQPGSLTPSVDQALVVCGMAWVGTVDSDEMSINESFIELTSGGVDSAAGVSYGAHLAYVIQTTAAAVNPTWSWSTGMDPTASCIASFKPGDAAPAVGLPFITTLDARRI